MTPENSEQPRETRYGAPIDVADRVRERTAGDVLVAVADAEAAQAGRAKVSSPELASLAAKYLDFTINDPAFAQTQADVRALAASVLAQAEGNPRK